MVVSTLYEWQSPRFFFFFDCLLSATFADLTFLMPFGQQILSGFHDLAMLFGHYMAQGVTIHS